MNRQRARELLPIIQAYADNKPIQYCNEGSDHWNNIVLSDWEFSDDSDKYRIKPKPRVIYVTEDSVNTICETGKSKNSYISAHRIIGEDIKFIEVIE